MSEEVKETVISPRDIIFEPRMEPNVPEKLNIKRTLFISFAFLSALAVLTYYNIAVPILLYDIIPEDFVAIGGIINADVLVGILMTLDNILAVTLQPFFASISDRTESKLGRRMPYIIIGVIGCSIFFGIAPWMHNLSTIATWGQVLGGFVSSLFIYNLFMSFYRSPALAMVADYTPEEHRSTASGVQQFIANIGTIIAFGLSTIVGLFVSKNMDKDARDVLIAKIGFPIISIVMLICLAVLLITIKETPTGKKFLHLSSEKIYMNPESFEIEESKTEKAITSGKRKGSFFELFQKDNISILLLFIAVFFWFSAFGALEAFFSKFATNYLELGLDIATLLGIVYPASMIVSAIPTGIIGHKFGRKRTLYGSIISLGILLAILSFIVVPSKNVLWLAIVLAFVGFFWMAVIVNTFPVVWSLCPKDEVGTYTGLYYTFNQSAAILSPILMGVLFNIVASRIGQNNPERFRYLFPFMLGCVLIAFLFLIFVKGGEAESEKDKLKEN